MVADARQSLGPLIALAALGLVMLAFIAMGPWIARALGYGVLVPAMLASGLLTIAATALAPAVPPRSGLVVILALALAMRLLLVGEDPLLSTDIYRYVWDGRVQAAGINPYLYVPADAALATLRDPAIYPNINRADYAVTAYPPVAQMVFFAVTRISETLVAMRLAMVACEIAVVAVIIDLLRRLQLPTTAVVAWAWHPLAIWEIAHSGHVEALMVALLMQGVWLLVRSRALAGAVAVALATLVKPYAVIALPAFWRPWDWRVPLAVAAAVALCYLPYLGAGRGALGFLATGYLSEEGFAGGEAFWLVALARAAFGNVPGLTTAYLMAAAGVMAWLALRTLRRDDATPQATLQGIALLLMAGLFFLSPNYAWYVLAVVPFIALGGGAPAWAMTLGAILLYRPWLLPDNDLAWKTLAILPFIVAAAVALLRRRRAFTPLAGASQWTI
jgi:alpha-1,6-mannosyltransferase